MCSFFRIGTPSGVKNVSSHAHKTGSWYLLGGSFQYHKNWQVVIVVLLAVSQVKVV